MKIYESAEMYLETILILQKEKECVLAVDIARKMSFSKPSVSVAVHALEADAYIAISDSGCITLTAKGADIAERIYERHLLIGEMLEYLGVDSDTAYADACKIEHDISDESFNCIKNFYKKYKNRKSLSRKPQTAENRSESKS